MLVAARLAPRSLAVLALALAPAQMRMPSLSLTFTSPPPKRPICKSSTVCPTALPAATLPLVRLLEPPSRTISVVVRLQSRSNCLMTVSTIAVISASTQLALTVLRVTRRQLCLLALPLLPQHLFLVSRLNQSPSLLEALWCQFLESQESQSLPALLCQFQRAPSPLRQLVSLLPLLVLLLPLLAHRASPPRRPSTLLAKSPLQNVQLR